MSDTKPKARMDLNYNPINHEGRTLIVVQDPLGIIGESICLSEVAGFLLSLMDGTRTLGEIQATLSSANGNQVPEDLVERLFGEMERIGLIEDDAYWKRRSEITSRFVRSQRREPSHASEAYNADPEALGRWIEGILDGSGDSSDVANDSPPRVLVAPHIDFRVNTKVYGRAYRLLRDRKYDRVVLMGTGHSILDGIYCPSSKDFATPLGLTPNDRAAVERLGRRVEGVVCGDDFPHKQEHALEFQLIFLQHLLGPEDFEVVPILCGSVHHLLHRISRLREDPNVAVFINELREIVFEKDRTTLIVAGVDFSHIGLRFSHQAPASELMEDTRHHDRDLIEAFTGGDAGSFWRYESLTSGRFNVCGFSTLATILEIYENESGRALAYDVWDDSPTGSAVSFAALTI